MTLPSGKTPSWLGGRGVGAVGGSGAGAGPGGGGGGAGAAAGLAPEISRPPPAIGLAVTVNDARRGARR